MPLEDADDPLYDYEYPDEDVDDDDDFDESISCPHCGEPIFEDSVACPCCGAYVIHSTSAWLDRPAWWLILGVVGIGATIAALAASGFFGR